MECNERNNGLFGRSRSWTSSGRFLTTLGRISGIYCRHYHLPSPNHASDIHLQAASLNIWDAESNQASSNDRQEPTTPNKVIVWSSHLTDAAHIERYLQKERYIIQTWVPSDDALPHDLLSKGYSLIMSTKNAWYFDHGFWGQTLYYQWRKVYENRIPAVRGVLGGEACVWTEIIDENILGI